ncbi:SDR family NAD(P)-dependent oxidoreductase [Pelagerythrobacter sp.]|uniref:SDR family NAD(P)-dependent oxidoreductase n=1 Tax=Pelagerythrobacter sp. TaxID=2800702 RepID=UPI0035B01693
MTDLTSKRALVTGGSRGIGAAIAKALAENGADVAITYQSSAGRAQGVVAEIEKLGRRAVAIEADSGDVDAIRRSVEETVKALGGIDILVNNAAVGVGGMIADLDFDQFQKMLDVNVRGPVAYAQAAIPHLKDGGRIISIGSALGDRVPFPGITAYSMSKSALLSFTRGLARELGPQGITVNIVAPGSTDTEMNPADGEQADYQRSLTAVGRYAKPREIADVVAFLASPAAAMVTGGVVTVDGGANA